MHAGPHAANLHRQRVWRQVQSGKVSFAEWEERERRRDASRIKRLWKADPWLAGSTIDLGEHEGTFRNELSALGYDLFDMPPSILDWLRWAFRRTQIDRNEQVRWREALERELPDRLRLVSPRPAHQETEHAANELTGAHPVWRTANVEDNPRGKRRRSGRQYRFDPVQDVQHQSPRPGRQHNTQPGEDEITNLYRHYRESRETLWPILENCTEEHEKLRVLRAWRDRVERPESQAALKHWIGIVAKYRPH